MGNKNKRKHPELDEILERPWCYYCERDFDDLKILINHQKAKHYKCERCGRRLNTAGGLSVHMTQVHKESLASIENALGNRAGLDVEIFGMEGVPEDVNQSHRQRVIQQYAQAEAERRAATGNPGPGDGANGAAKKPKIEEVSDVKKRLAEHKAKKAAEAAAGVNTGNNSMGEPSDRVQSPAGYPQAGSPNYLPQQPNFNGPNNPPYQNPVQPYGQQQAPPFSQHSSPPPFSQAPPSFSPAVFKQSRLPPQQFQPPSGQGHSPFQGGPQFQNGPPQFQGGPPPQFQNGPPPHFQSGPPPQFQNGPPQFLGGPPQFQNGPQFAHGLPQQYGSGSPAPFSQNQFQPPRQNITPPHFNSIPQRPGSLPSAPGLPQRPTGGPPPVDAAQLQQMHLGHLPAQQNPLSNQQSGLPRIPMPPATQGPPAGNVSSVGVPVPGASQDADKTNDLIDSKSEQPKVAPEEKKGKKEKDRGMRLVYSDNDVSPEEKMAKLPRYAFAPAA
ncbi:uncharacterized protein KY384_001325 [Bacidia gigantensis]|uniref:uncharacterized protein n=1 Tax=Bacidia gigantensis TaxID=2732470 RepID=UPI001D03CCAB|nr:uncharacterized protein KY384_001325 [Bacidia gigantensis]KAG8533585.1 hypothetical protein KY384_001325 [Bacidia gigantensis]